jgi:cell division protein FtsL
MAVSAAAARPLRRKRTGVRPVQTRGVAKRRAARSKGVAGGVVWIVFLSALLAGVVALNVAVLRLNVELDGLAREKQELRAGNNELASRLAGLEASGRVQALARKQLGLVPAEPDQTTYITLDPASR